MTTDKQHVFETAGLGKAPFTWIGCYIDRGPHKSVIGGVVVEVGAPGQPMGTCAYCGTGIAECHQIRSTDGKTFIVGSDCVDKTGDKGLKARVNEAKRQAKRQADARKIEENWAWVEQNREALAAIPHGRYTMIESIEWFYRNAGQSGKLRIVREAKRALA